VPFESNIPIGTIDSGDNLLNSRDELDRLVGRQRQHGFLVDGDLRLTDLLEHCGGSSQDALHLARQEPLLAGERQDLAIYHPQCFPDDFPGSLRKRVQVDSDRSNLRVVDLAGVDPARGRARARACLGCLVLRVRVCIQRQLQTRGETARVQLTRTAEPGRQRIEHDQQGHRGRVQVQGLQK